MYRPPQLALALTAAAAFPAAAHASLLAAVPNCSPTSDKPDCGLGGFLHLLYIAAAILAVILVAVVAIAIHLYRNNEKSEIDHR